VRISKVVIFSCFSESPMTQLDPNANFDLPATLDPNAARLLVDELGRLSRDSEVRLNAAAVSAVSPGYLQILVSAFKTFPNIGVSNPSAEFSAALAEYGIDFPAAPVAPSGEISGLEVVAAEHDPEFSQAVESLPEDPSAGEDEILPTAEDARTSVAAELQAPQPAELSGEIVPLAHASEEQVADAPAAKRILTIDDSRTMRDMLRMTLAGAGFTVIQAVDGEDGLNALAQQPVDLIITDINMPKLDGFGVIRAVRSDHTHDNTPILVLSTEGEQESKDIAKNAGATGWIVKPFDPEGLVKLVNTVCG
jgi:two-component system, chemotaxis family, chemotaxis protein CheY